MSKNKEIAKIFYKIADFLAMDEIQFKPIAYRKVAFILNTMEQSVEEIYNSGGLKALDRKIPGVGKNIALKIEEYLKTGKIKYYEKLKKQTPIDFSEIINVEGMGPKKAKVLIEKLGIRNLKDLERAAKTGKIAPLFGFGKKTQQNILQAIKFLKASKGRFLLGEILPIVHEIEKQLKTLKQIKKISIAGSFRRKKETIGDLDFLIALKKTKNPEAVAKKVMDFFTSLPGVIKVWGRGITKSSIRLEYGCDADLRVVPAKSYGAALQYFTGSVGHNIVIRKIAMSKGMKLNEYGLFKGKKRIAGKTEKEIYKKLGMDLPAPEIRENQGEIGAALKGKLPKLVELKHIKGDLHCHSNWSDGAHSIKQMAQTAINMGYEYLGISDHTKFLKVANGLNAKRLAEQKKEINSLNSKFEIRNSKFRILKGCEVNILNNGLIDIKDEALKKLDYVIAGIHSDFKMPKNEMTERIIKAMQNPNIHIIAHPFTRVLKKREPCKIDFNKILRAAKQFNVILEINAFPARLDLNDKNIRLAKQAGVKMIIGSDAHHKDQLKYMEFGVSQARRGWAEKRDIVNTRSLSKLLKLFK